jgi:hypothetical protein
MESIGRIPEATQSANSHDFGDRFYRSYRDFMRMVVRYIIKFV